MTKLSFPFTEEKIRALKVGDEVLISGIVFTGRDAVHKYLHEGGKPPPEVKLRDGILHHHRAAMIKNPVAQLHFRRRDSLSLRPGDDEAGRRFVEMHRRRPDHV